MSKLLRMERARRRRIQVCMTHFLLCFAYARLFASAGIAVAGTTVMRALSWWVSVPG